MKFRNMFEDGKKISAGRRLRRCYPFCTLLPTLAPTEISNEELALEYR
jgi:hypothetical protein